MRLRSAHSPCGSRIQCHVASVCTPCECPLFLLHAVSRALGRLVSTERRLSYWKSCRPSCASRLQSYSTRSTAERALTRALPTLAAPPLLCAHAPLLCAHALLLCAHAHAHVTTPTPNLSPPPRHPLPSAPCPLPSPTLPPTRLPAREYRVVPRSCVCAQVYHEGRHVCRCHPALDCAALAGATAADVDA